MCEEYTPPKNRERERERERDGIQIELLKESAMIISLWAVWRMREGRIVKVPLRPAMMGSRWMPFFKKTMMLSSTRGGLVSSTPARPITS